MARQWGKVARWAGIGNNGEDGGSTRSGDGMAKDRMVEGIEDRGLRDKGVKDGELEGKKLKGKELKDRELESKNGELKENELKVEVPAETSGPQTIEAGGEGSAEPAAALKIELEQVRGERDQLMDRLARLQAEFENARRREAKERADSRDYALQNAVEPFLGVMDNFQLALKAEGTLEQLRGGVELILKQMEEALRGLNVQTVETVGTMFDPRIHEALGSIETAEFPDHQVMEEIRRGYRIRDKLLRPALVRIASNAAQVAE